MSRTRAQTAVGSLAWVILLALITLAVIALLYLAFNESLQFFFDRPEWQPDSSESSANADDIAAGHRTLEALWTVVLPLGVTAVAVSVLVRSRRAGG